MPNVDRSRDDDDTVIPLVTEELTVARRAVETGRVKIDIVNEPRTQQIVEQLVRGGVEIERVAIGRQVDRVPPMREEGDMIIVPVVEEILVVEKRLMLVEEVRIHRTATIATHDEKITLTRQHAVIERLSGRGEPVGTPRKGEV